MVPGCVRVERANKTHDLRGVDYYAELESGIRLGIDTKTRSPGCSAYWATDEPEIALETWSEVPANGASGRIGWTLDQSKITDLVLYTYPPQDCDRCYLFGFHHLRAAFHANGRDWVLDYKCAKQKTEENGRSWQSECVFVPVTIVQAAIQRISVGRPSSWLEAAA